MDDARVEDFFVSVGPVSIRPVFGGKEINLHANTIALAAFLKADGRLTTKSVIPEIRSSWEARGQPARAISIAAAAWRAVLPTIGT